MAGHGSPLLRGGGATGRPGLQWPSIASSKNRTENGPAWGVRENLGGQEGKKH